MKAKQSYGELKAGVAVFGLITALVLVLAATALLIPAPATAVSGQQDVPQITDTAVNSFQA